ncbi:HK97 family phage prohead protease [Staphylococcus pseudintermedius]|uniref:HK97 family phage prohead protease n=1 Tax=Staphylococcus pseudintermedius TaxID=283734 RepID=UPI0018F52CDF|nr:HK97 family phage prohead protease [Staphylococcus pseudintermedius]EGQ3151768.1 HK97 family phage prohead protease [Staphylococcus pseudintermedius]EGQ3871460.1 HK97 family phage prohead protease [Staphylococcus pseudintermedius]EHL7209601.1 HK97 family phage prohead protease [Staphylococcus pseudintermedius]EIM5218835.1 HK97 family phage prohead protease [Staphylococcus pseudintermedius]EIT0973752.1 HK97 family phage prohead protease [Staphylococcus pseudintermedius]
MNTEIRALETIKAVDDEQMIVEGYALRFNTLSNDLGGFVETILPEALEKTDLSDVRCLIDHDSSKVLGRTVSKTLELNVDDEGLYFRCQLPNTSYARDLYENIKLQNINQCSFGFILDDEGDSFDKRDDGLFKRTIKKIKSLFDVSIVTYPAYNDTDVAPALRSIEAIKESEKQKAENRRKLELFKTELEFLKLK